MKKFFLILSLLFLEVSMAEEQVEPTISLNDKQFKHLLADVRGENNSW